MELEFLTEFPPSSPTSGLSSWTLQDWKEYAGDLSRLPDEIILRITDFLDRKSLGRLCITNHFFRSFCQETCIQRKIWTPFVVSVGGDFAPFTGAIDFHGRLFMWGKNNHGELGLGDESRRAIPSFVTDFSEEKIVSISCGTSHTGCVTEQGELYMWGGNARDQLGLRHRKNALFPQRVDFFPEKETILSVSCGASYTGCVTEKGHLYMWGDNRCGQLGLGDKSIRTVPSLVTVLSEEKVVSVSCGYDHAGCITEEGTLYMWGDNSWGQLGLGPITEAFFPFRVKKNLLDSFIVSVSCSLYSRGFTGCITNQGELYMWGDNSLGHLGLGHDHNKVFFPQRVEYLLHSRVVNLSCGPQGGTGAVTSDGTLYTWGWNLSGELGLGHRKNVIKIPTEVFFPEEDEIVMVSCGYSTGAVTVEGNIYMWGDNKGRLLGVDAPDDSKESTEENVLVPTLVSSLQL